LGNLTAWQTLLGKEYVGVIWIGESPGIRLSVMARSAGTRRGSCVAV
jgi:hypothetical protein